MMSNISFWLMVFINVSRYASVSREIGPRSETESSSDVQERDATFASASFVSCHFFPTTRGAT